MRQHLRDVDTILNVVNFCYYRPPSDWHGTDTLTLSAEIAKKTAVGLSIHTYLGLKELSVEVQPLNDQPTVSGLSTQQFLRMSI